MKLGVFLPGRLQSERLPNKLILPLGESCLWDMACKKLNSLPDKYNKYVLCNDKELVDIASKYTNIKIIIRDPETCQVDGPLTYIFKDLKDLPETHLMFLNPCLSFLEASTILTGLISFEYYQEHNTVEYATSVKPMQNWIFKEDGDETTSVTDIDYERLSTKEIKGYWQAAHCFHIFNKDQFFADGMMLKEGHGIIPVREEATIDVDTELDYKFAKMLHSKKYVIDIDGTICTSSFASDYKDAQPMMDRIKIFNRLHEAGNTIWYQTARGYVTGQDHRSLTESQLKQWGVKYDRLLFGKPNADVYIDDKAENVEDIIRRIEQ